MATRGLDHWGDILVVILYFVIVLAVGLWAACRQNKGTVNSYFLASRSMIWLPVGASLFSSNIGSEHFVGLAGTGAASGIAIVSYEWFSLPLVICLAWLFLPVYISAGVYTLPEYLEKRFGGRRIRIYMSVLALVLYIVTKLAVSIFAGALFIQLALGWDMYLSIAALLVITGIYTILGGLAAVIYTDTFQTAVMTLGAFALVGISFNEIGGYNNLERKYMQSIPSVRDINSTCGYPREDSFHMFRDPVTADNPWPGLLLQSSIGCLWYWCCDQVIVQRALAAKNLSHAKGGAIVAGYLKLLPLFIMIFPGMISRALYPDEVGCIDPDECRKHCDNPVGCSNIAYPKLVLELMPYGLRGLLMAVMLSAIMSSLTSIFNSSSTLFTMDLWRKMRPRATERELLLVGRIFIVVLCGISILWIPLVRSSQGGQLFIYIQAVQGYLGTPIGALFLLAILWKRMNEQGAFWGILIGHMCGVIRMAIDFSFPAPECDQPDTRPAVLANVHYTYFGSLLLVITSLSIVVISLITKPQPDEESEGLTWWTRHKHEDEPDVKDQENSVEKSANGSTNSIQTENIKNGRTNSIAENIKNGSTNSIAENIKNGSTNSVAENGMVVEEPTANQTERSRFRRWFEHACGVSHSEPQDMNLEIEQTKRFLKEKPIWRTILNLNACIALVVMAFMFGFYH